MNTKSKLCICRHRGSKRVSILCVAVVGVFKCTFDTLTILSSEVPGPLVEYGFGGGRVSVP